MSGQIMVNLPMLWISLRLNWGNTLAVSAFCLLAVLGAVSHALVYSGGDDGRPRKAEVGTPYADAAAPMTAVPRRLATAD